MTSSGADDGKDSKSQEAPDSNIHEQSLSLDTVLMLLSHYQRRALLQHLRRAQNHTRSIDECVSQILNREAEQPGEQPSAETVQATLYHAHIPKLADASVVEYDPRNSEIRYWGNERLETWLDRIRVYEEQG